jgi:hypothetical protein
MTIAITKQIYKPSMTVGQVFARLYGSTDAPMPIGNVLELQIDHSEDTQTQPDMTVLGGGTYSEVRRVKEVKISMKLADLNVTNLARSILGVSSAVATGTVTDEAHTVQLGGLVRLAHIGPSAVTVKKGATVIAAAGNYTISAAGLRPLADADDLLDDDDITVSYTHPAYAVVEAMTTKARELELIFEGLNEADSGNPMVVEIWRASQGITKKLALINKDHNTLDVEGTLLLDPTKTATGVSRYYKVSMV